MARLLFVALALVAGAIARGQLAVGDAFPPLRGADVDGNLPDLAGKVAVVDFWASWCAPCKASFPGLARLHDEFAPRGVIVLGLGQDEREQDHAKFLKKFAPPFAIVRDRGHAVAKIVKPPTMPTTFVLGRDGRVSAVLTGYHGAESERALRAAINDALAR